VLSRIFAFSHKCVLIAKKAAAIIQECLYINMSFSLLLSLHEKRQNKSQFATAIFYSARILKASQMFQMENLSSKRAALFELLTFRRNKFPFTL